MRSSDGKRPLKGVERVRKTAASRPSSERPVSERRDQILRIAARRFAEFGFEATTIREIAQDAQILSGSIYHHFDTKDEMLHGLIHDPLIALRDSTLRIAEADCDAEHKLTAFILLSMRELIADQYVQAILYNERKLFRRRPDFDYVSAAKGVVYQNWSLVLSDGVAAGLFKKGIDTFLTITTIIRMLNTCADWFRHEDEYEWDGKRHYSLDEVVNFNLDFVLSAIRDPARVNEAIPLDECRRLIEALELPQRRN